MEKVEKVDIGDEVVSSDEDRTGVPYLTGSVVLFVCGWIADGRKQKRCSFAVIASAGKLYFSGVMSRGGINMHIKRTGRKSSETVEESDIKKLLKKQIRDGRTGKVWGGRGQ